MTLEAKAGNIGSAFDNNFKNWMRKYFKRCIPYYTNVCRKLYFYKLSIK